MHTRNYFKQGGWIILRLFSKMMNAVLLICGLWFLVSCNSLQNELDCSRFKTGKFKYVAHGSGNAYIIERDDSTQVETNLISGSVFALRVKWITPCDYELTLSRKGSPTDTLFILPTSTIVKTKIIETGNDYYVFSSQAVGMDKVLTDTLKAVHE